MTPFQSLFFPCVCGGMSYHLGKRGAWEDMAAAVILGAVTAYLLSRGAK